MNVAALVERWNALQRRARIAIVATVVGLLACAALLASVERDTRVPLFANALKPDQLAEVDAQLSGWNVAFLPAHDNIRVDARHRGELLARLALAGVPHAHVAGTSEALATVGTLTPQAILDAQARAGLEGDLEKSLRGLGGIAEARVILAPARGGVFADEATTPATAGVRLTAAAGIPIAASTIAAVRAFVASGVPGLDVSHVTVVDDRGTLDDDRNDEGRERESALQSALDAAFGVGSTIVRVHVERTAGASESRDVRSVPHSAALIRRNLDEHFTGEKKSYTRRQSSEDRGSNVHEERTTIAAGTIARVAIAVLVDAHRNFDLQKIRDVAAAAAGYDQRRGDTLSVEAVPFDRPYGASPRPIAYALGVAAELLPILALAAVAIAGIRAGARPLVMLVSEFSRRRNVQRSAPHMRELPADSIFSTLRDEPAHVAAAVIATLETPLASAVLERFAPSERRAIVDRLERPRTPLVAQLREIVLHGH